MNVEWKGTPPAKEATPMELAPAPAAACEDGQDSVALAGMKESDRLAMAAGADAKTMAATLEEEWRGHQRD